MYIVVWKRKDNSYYYRYYRGYKNYTYFVGYTNQYEHEVILIIEPTVKQDNFMRKKTRSVLRWLYKRI